MEWDASLEIGIPVIDEQHQSLFRQVDDLLDHSKADRVRETLTFLAEYVLMHFGAEESMHHASKYPDALSHKKMHEAFVETLGELNEEYESTGGEMLILMKITKIALDWLKYHIKGADKDFGEYLKKSGLNDFANLPMDPVHASGSPQVIRANGISVKKP